MGASGKENSEKGVEALSELAELVMPARNKLALSYFQSPAIIGRSEKGVVNTPISPSSMNTR